MPITQKFRLPQSLIFFVTSRCNARCPFCLYYEQVNNPVASKEELTVFEVDKIAASYGKLHYLGISGGEPFVRKDMVELCEAFIQRCDVAVIDIPSNFYYRNNMLEFVTRLLSKYNRVTLDLQLSIDHIGKKHDELRLVDGLYNRAIETFKQLDFLRKKFSNLHLKVNVVYMDENKNDLNYIFDELKNTLKFDRMQLTFPHYLLPGGTIGKQKQLQNELKNYLHFSELADALTSSNQSNAIYSLGLRSLKKYYRELLADALSDKKNTGSYCEAGKNILVLNEKGDVFPCEQLWGEKIGNLREHDYDIRKILSSQRYAEFREKYLGPGKCNCTWSCAMNTHVSVNPAFFPKLGMNAFRLLTKSN